MQFSRFSGSCQVHCSEKMRPFPYIQEDGKGRQIGVISTLMDGGQTGLSKSALGKYESEDFKDISPFAIVTLAKFYGVSTDYLLGLTEQKNHPDTALSELHLNLSDDAIEVLKNGKFNNRTMKFSVLYNR